MSIEIRPTAVTSQIEEKARILRAALRSLDQVDLAISSFSGSGDSLKGAGYDAARSHMSQYTQLVDAVRRSINATLDADGVVRRALGDFGGAGRVSEAEWREKLDYAERQISSLQAQARSLVQSTPPTAAGLECELMSINGSVQAWRRQADEAGRVLSHIYGYCAATNGAYEGKVEEINAMASAGAAQLANCSFSVSGGSIAWSAIDQDSWFNQEVYDSCAPLIERVYGDVSNIVLDNPVVSDIADWWEENGTTITNVGKVAFGVVGVAGAIAMIASGIGAPAGIATLAGIAGTFGLTYSLLDVGTGLGGLATGKELDWESGLSHGLADAAGADGNAVEAGVKGFGIAVNLVNVAKLPANAGRLLNSAGDLADLSKSAKSAELAASGLDPLCATKASNMAGSSESALRKEIAGSAIDLVENLEDPFDLVTDAANGLAAAKKKEMKYDAYSENAAPGYSY